MAEVWKAIPGYEGKYDVSTRGRVRSFRKCLDGRALAPVPNSDSYLTVQLIDRRFRVHRLVCEAFSGPAPEGAQAAHLDGCKTNNHVDNLAWVSPKENTGHKRLHGTHQAGERHPRAKLTAEQATAIRASKGRSVDIGKLYGVHESTVRNIRHGARWAEASQSGAEGNRPTSASHEGQGEGS